MSIELQVEAALLLLLSAILSTVIGLNRERHGRSAGLRTHMMVGLGSCLFTLLSVYAFPGPGDTARVAAQIVTGIGFIGAGTIIQHKRDVHQLTTAASIWATAAIGMAVGVGAWFLATAATLIVWIVLALILRLVPKED